MGPPIWRLCPLLIVSFACFIFLMPAKIFNLCVQMCVLPASMSLYQNYSVQRDQKRALNPLELESQRAVSSQVGAGH